MAIAVLLAAPAAQASFAGKNGRIAFERAGSDSWIVSMRSDGSRVRELSRGTTPSYSTDGRIAYSCFKVCVMNANGSGNRIVADRGGDPAFSASGERIVFAQCRPIRIPGRCRSEIWLMTDEGHNQRQISRRGPTDEEPADQPTFSSLGLIAFQRDNAIWTMRADGSDQTRLSAGSLPDFSPDGRRLAFASGRSIFTLPVSGGEPRRLVRGSAPAWSPNGRRIAYTDHRPHPTGGSQDEIFTVKVTGEDRRRLTRTSSNEGAPSWSPRRRTARCGRVRATIVGTPRPDRIGGTQGRDVIQARGGDDVIRGRGGVDHICGGRGDDLTNGHEGPDRLIGGPGDDVLRGNRGRDAVFGGKGFDRCFGGKGPDTARCERSESA